MDVYYTQLLLSVETACMKYKEVSALCQKLKGEKMRKH